MARLSRVFLGPAQRNCPQTRDRITAAAIAPGSLVFINSSNQFAVHATDGGGSGVRLYVMNYNYLGGGQIDDNVPSGDTGTAYERFEEDILAMPLAAGQNITAQDTALASNGDGTLRVGVVGTDYIVGFYAEDAPYNNNTGSAQLVAVRQAKG